MTGASAGLGREFARQLARRGHPLVLVARREAVLREVAADIVRLYRVSVHVVAADLATPEGRAVCRAAMDARPPRVAVLNAGFGSRGALADLDREREVRMVDLNCAAVVDLAHHAVGHMRARGGGDLVVVSSAAAFQGIPSMATYAATKAFELRLVEGLAREVRGDGIRVTALCPGPTRTEFADAIDRDGGRSVPGGGWGWWMPTDEPREVVSAAFCALESGRTRVATGLVARAASLGSALPRTFVVGIADGLHRLRSRGM